MLTRLIVRNFKRFAEVDVELGDTVVLIGPNNSGKTTALQAMTLWNVGLRAWMSRRGGQSSPEKRPGVAINRKDLLSIPVPAANLLWRELHTRQTRMVGGKRRGTSNVRIEVMIHGVTQDQAWECGFEFDYSNEESFYCRPVRLAASRGEPVGRAEFTTIPEDLIGNVKVAFLPPMSGLADREYHRQRGEIDVLIGQGQTAQVLRNLCYQVLSSEANWESLVQRIHSMFGVQIERPQFIGERSELVMGYQERGVRLDIANAGRGLQQTLMLLAHLYVNPHSVLLLDEPDAHLEILRQRQTYQLITEVAREQGCQIIAASHSEVVLNEAAGRGQVIAFVGKPHPLVGARPSQLIKSLTDIGWDQYYLAETRGWILFLEGATDLAILRAFSRKLGHPAARHLEDPFVHYVATNLPSKARDLFHGLAEAKPDLVGIAVFDRLDLQKHEGKLVEHAWSRREIENYLCSEKVLIRYAEGRLDDDLFGMHEQEQRVAAMRQSLQRLESARRTLDRPALWSPDTKASDDVLDPLFKLYFKQLGLPLLLRKSDYFLLAELTEPDEIDHEVVQVLDLIESVASSAKPVA